MVQFFLCKFKINLISLFLLLILLFTGSVGWGQTTYTLGSGATTSTSDALVPIRPWYKKHRIQYLIKATELTSLGAKAGEITNLAIYVSEAPTTDMEGFNIHIGTTSSTALSGSWITGLTNVYSADPQDDADFSNDAWTSFNLSSTINWDGESNLVVEFCFDNSGSNYSEAGGIYVYDPGTYNCAQTIYSDTDGYGCGTSNSPSSQHTTRAQLKFTIEEAPTFHNTGGSSQLAFNNSYIFDSSPTFRVSHDVSGGMDAFQIEVNTASDFGGTSHKQSITGTYSSGTQYNLDCSALDNSWSPSNGTTYYVRVRMSDDSGSTWGAWSTEPYSFTYKSSGDPDWYQTTDAQFESGTYNASPEDNYGNAGTVSSGVTGWNGYQICQRITGSESGTLASLSVNLSNASGNVKMAIYEYDDEYDSDGTTYEKIVETSSVSASNGWNILLVAETELTDDYYYVAVMLDDNATRLNYSVGSGTSGYYSQAYASGFMSDISGVWTTDGYNYLMYATFSDEGSITSPLVDFASFDGASSWNEISWNTSGSGTVTFQVYYDNSGSIDLVPNGDVANNSTGIASTASPIDISGLSTTTYEKLFLKATLSSASASLDDWTVTCNFGLDLDSEAEAPTTQVAATNIASTVDTDGESQEVFAFDITDLGTADGQPTKVTNIRIKPGNNNAGDWTDFIQGVKLYDNDASGFVTIGSPTITDSYIDIPITSGNLNIADGGTKALSLYVYLNNSGIIDNTILDFRIDYDDHGFTAATDGSRFADTFGSADIEGNNMTVTVTATELQFHASEPGSIEALSQDFDVIVYATDENGNTDDDYASGNVTLSVATGSGSLSATSGLTQFISSGEISWTDIQYNASETCPGGLTITASHSGALTSATTSCIAIESGPEAFDITTSNGEGCGGGNVSIAWDASTNATSYDLYWCNTSGCNPSDGDNIITGVTSPYSFAISDNGATYQVRILAKNSADERFSTNMLVYVTHSNGTWIGGTSTDWSNTANWCGGSVPDCEDEIIIMAGASFNPVLTESVSVGSITIESGASLGLGSYTMTVYGDITLDNSTLTAGTGTIQFANSGCATAPGTHNFDPGDNTLNDFIINTDYVYIVNNDLKLSGDLTINEGTLDANGNDLEIAGNWTNYSLFVPGTGSVTFNGNSNSTIIKDGPEVVVYATSFEDSDLGTLGWSLGKVPGKTEWRRQSGAVSGDRLAPADGTYDLALYDLMDSEPGYAYDGTTDHNSYVDAQKKIDLTDVSSADISFKWYCHGTGTDEFTGVFLADGVEIDDALYNMDGGSNPVVPTSWTTEIESLDAFCNKEVQLTFRMFMIKYSHTNFPEEPGDYGFAIDDIEITGTESAESFNNLVINKSGGTVFFDDGTDSKVNVMGDISISSGTLNVQGNFLRCFGDFTNDGTFTHGTDGEIIFKGDGDQTISGTSDVTFEKLRIDKAGDLYVGHASVAGFDVTVNDTLIWSDNDNNLIIGNGATASLSLPGDLTVRNGCGFETANGSTIAMKGHYVNYGTYTPNNGKVLLNGDRDSYIIKEPSEILYYEGFETDDGGFTLGGNSNESFVRSSGSAHSSNYDIAVEATTQNVPYDYLYSSTDDITAEITIDLTGYETAELQFWWRCAGEDGYDYGQLYVNDNLLMDNMHGHTFYTQSPRFDISEYANGEVTLKFRWQDDGSGGNSPGLCFDDILITGTSINQETFYNLEVNKDASNDNYALLRCPIDVDNNMTILNGHLDSGGISFPVGGNWTNDNSSYFEHKNNTITFDGNNDDKDQVITNNGENNFYNIIIDNNGNDISLEGERLYIENDLDIDAGNLDANTEDIMIEGDWSNGGGTFDASNTTVYFRGDIDQQVISDGDAFYNLTLPLADDPTAGDPAKDNAVIMNDNLTINKNIMLSAGALDTDDTYNIDIKGNWYNEGGGFIHPNDATTEVKFSGTGMQKVNIQSDDSRYEANFSFDNVVIDGADVRFYVDSDNYLLLSRNLTINATKIFKLIQNTP